MTLNLSEAFWEAVMTITHIAGVKPLPNGLTKVDAGDWELAFNNSTYPFEKDGIEYMPFQIYATNKDYFAIAIIGPDGGMIGGGVPESDFIDQMKAARETVQ